LLMDVDELYIELKIQVMSLLPLDAHHFLYTLSNVELLEDLPELVRLYLSVVEHILDNKAHHVGR
jgi:hypothetical protein